MRVDFENLSSMAAYDADASTPIVVLKFGSSVLRTRDDLYDVVTEIYRHVREGRKVVAVVSAFAGETDVLIAEAAAVGAGPSSRHAPRLVSLGEERSAALLAIACEATGLEARILGARILSLKAGGPVNDAHPQSANVNLLRDEIARRDVVIVPGFVALGDRGEPVLLGRGGSDLTAVFLAAALGLRETTLMKDVDGVYDRDPATATCEAMRFRRLDWRTARDIAGKLLQPKAIDFAAAHQVAIRVLRLNGAEGTYVSAKGEAPSRVSAPHRLRVAVAGLGLIGEGVALRLARDNPDYELCAALVREPFKERAALAVGQVTNDLAAFFATKPDVVIDALPDGTAGRVLAVAAFDRGVSVISANKQAIAGAIAALTAKAQGSGAALRYAAAVGGGAPFLETVARARRFSDIHSLEAVLNGTVNFILTSLARGVAFDEAVVAAQQAGFAEPDPSADLSGDDARAKIGLLSYAAFGEEIAPGAIEIEALGAAKAARFTADGGEWRQVARLDDDGAGRRTASVRFERRDDDPLFAGTHFEANALRVTLADGRTLTCRGKGAGRRPTVESLLGDLGAIRRERLTRDETPAVTLSPIAVWA